MLEHTVGPVVRAARRDGSLQHWYFTRWVDARGPHVRLTLAHDTSVGVDEALRQQLLRVSAAPQAPAREPVLGPPASHRQGERIVGVESVAFHPEHRRFGAALGGAQTLFESSSEVILDALPVLPRGRERLAFGLALAEALTELGLAPTGREELWHGIAARWTGSEGQADGVLTRLEDLAERLGPRLSSQVSTLTGHPTLNAALRRYARACEDMLATGGAPATDLVRHHAHLTSNRLGVNPLEEALLACIMARVPGGGSAGEPERPAEAVSVQGASKDADGLRILDDVTLTVQEGEVFGVVGPEGAGKSSLIGVAAGLRAASRGTVRILGLDPLTQGAELAGEVAVLPPDDELAEPWTVRESVEHAHGATREADEVLELIGLHGRADATIGDLDRGERRRAAIGHALMTGPQILFCDEPTMDLAPQERAAVWRTLRATGTTVVIASTSLQEMRSACDRAALVLAGEVVDVGQPDELARRHFSRRRIRFETAHEPDGAALDRLPEVERADVRLRDGRWTIEAICLQPDELLRVVGNDPALPAVVSVALEDLEGTFLSHAESAA